MKNQVTLKGQAPFQTRGSTGKALLALLSLMLLLSAYAPCVQAQEDSSIIGRIVAWRSGKISTQVPGLVKELRVRVGDRVKKGDILAVFDTSQRQLDVARAQGELAAAKSKVKIAKAKMALKENILARQKRLKRTNVFLVSKYDEAVLNHAIAKAEVLAAQAEVTTKQALLKRQKLDIELSTIRAPYSGVVKQLFAQKGAFVIPESPHLLELVDDSSLELEVDMPVSLLHHLKRGDMLKFRLDAKLYKARLRSVLPTVNMHSQTRAIRLKPLQISILKTHAIGQNIDVLLPAAKF